MLLIQACFCSWFLGTGNKFASIEIDLLREHGFRPGGMLGTLAILLHIDGGAIFAQREVLVC